MRGATVGGSLALYGSKVGGPLDAASVRVGGSLLLGRDGMHVATFRDVVLHLGRIGGILDMIGSQVAGRIDAELLHVDGDANLVQAGFVAPIDMAFSRFGGRWT